MLTKELDPDKSELVSLIIPNYNGLRFFNNLFKSIFNQSYKNFEIIVVDNGSTDGSLAYLKQLHNIRLIINKKNLGFAKAVNSGIKEANGHFLFIINNDTELDQECINKLVRAFKVASKSKENIIGLAPKIFLDGFNRKIIDAIGTGIMPDGSAFNIGIGQIDLGQYRGSFRVMGLCFAAAFILKEAFEKVGYLDESYFAYYEDIDWCYRANILGHQFYTCPAAKVYHKHAASAREILSYGKKYYLIHRNFLRTIIKNYFRGNQIKSLQRILLYLSTARKALLKKDYENFLIHLRILLDTLIRLPRLVFSNYKINKRRKVYDGIIWELTSDPLLRLASLTFDPETYSPIISIGILEEIIRHCNLLENKRRLLEYLSLHMTYFYLQTWQIPFVMQARAWTFKKIARTSLKSSGKKLRIIDMLISESNGRYKIWSHEGCLSLDGYLMYVLLNSHNRSLRELRSFIFGGSTSGLDSSKDPIFKKGLDFIINNFKNLGLIGAN